MNTRARTKTGFTLIELLVVIGIIGVLATIGIPAMRGFGSSNAMSAANRQLLDDISMARLHAITERTTVYMVFVPPLLRPGLDWSKLSAPQRSQLTNRVAGQCTSYAFLTLRSPGDQPGRGTPRYLGDWKSLPEGVFIPTNKFAFIPLHEIWKQQNLTNRGLAHLAVPFPTAKSPQQFLPVIAFNYQGQLLGQNTAEPRRSDEFLQLARGSLVQPRDNNGKLKLGEPELIETPRGNVTNNPMIRIDWITGRAKIQEPKRS